MKLEIDNKMLRFIPEDDQDMFILGRMSKNMNMKIVTDKQHLEKKITDFEAKITDVIEMLTEAIIPMEEDDG
jgi:hypothetical protein